jgi:two-component system sensor histidine kinase CreC
MKKFRLTLGIRVFLSYLIISLGIFWYLAEPLTDKLKTSVDDAIEEVMSDTAYILAQDVGNQIKNNKIDIKNIYLALFKYPDQKITSATNKINRETSSLDVYITDKDGVVIYDSTNRYVGDDFSKDNDVYLTLRGETGTRVSNYDRLSKGQGKAMFVAKPIYHNNEIFGSLTVVKKYSRLGQFITALEQTSKEGAIYIFIVSTLLALGISVFVSRSIIKLVRYATSLSKGESVQPPKINQIEFNELSIAIAKLRSELEIKEHVEEYVSTMAHQLKSPIATIHAISQNLLMPMDSRQRESFISDISSENKKMGLLINRLLELSRLEKKSTLNNTKLVDIETLIKSVIKSLPELECKNITVEYDFEDSFTVESEELLAEQAIRNIIQNAVDFSPQDSTIEIKGGVADGFSIIQVFNQTPSIPKYVLERLFKKGFVSTPRPDTKELGNGIGLRFVKTIMSLHGGEVDIENNASRHGVVTTLKFPTSSL